MAEAYIIDTVRTPVGKRGGSLSQIHPADPSRARRRARSAVPPDPDPATLLEHRRHRRNQSAGAALPTRARALSHPRRGQSIGNDDKPRR